MDSIQLLDWLIVLIYLVGITWVGVRASNRVKDNDTFLISDRKFGKWMMVFFNFGAGTQADDAVAVVSRSYSVGVSGIWYQWLWLFVTPFYWLAISIIRRMRAVSMSDYFDNRYNRSVSLLYSIVGMVNLIVTTGLILKGSSAIMNACIGSVINEKIIVIVISSLFVIYGVAGGLAAAIITNLIQGILTIVLSFLILPFALQKVGGLSGLRHNLSDPALFQIISPDITVFFVAVISFNALIGWIAWPGVITLSAGKAETECQVGTVGGSLVKRVCTVAWMLTGVSAIIIFAGHNINADQTFGLMARELLPKIAPGLLGLFIAAMLAAQMSSCSASMVAAAGLFTEGFYRPLCERLKITKSQNHYVLISRIASILIVVAAVLYTFSLGSVIRGMEIFWKVSAMMGVAIWAGIFWRRATVAGAWTSTIAGVAVWLFTEQIPAIGWDFNKVCSPYLPACMFSGGALALHWQMIFYLGASFVTLIVVSYLTKPIDKEKLDKFYDCVFTPVTEIEPHSKPFRLPEGMKPFPRKKLINHPDFEIPVPSRKAVGGFTVITAIVISMIYIIKWMFHAPA